MDAIKRRSRYDDRMRRSTIDGGSDIAAASIASRDDNTFSGTSSNNNNFVEGGPLQPAHNHLINESSHLIQDTISPQSAIHIPMDLWENQLCPMGAWGENCCQNLPQPDQMGSHPQQHHSSLLSTTTSAMNPLETTTMDSILGPDWLVDYHNPNQAAMSSSSNKTGTTPLHFDASSLQGTPEESVVGPLYPLRKRKADSMAGTNSPSDWWTFQTGQSSNDTD
jgi:hypothetical protein